MGHGRWKNVSRGFAILHPLFSILALLAIQGCTTTTQSDKQTLNDASASLNAGQYDKAIRQADDYLKVAPHGTLAAEAYYIRGRGWESRSARNQMELIDNLSEARIAFLTGLSESPSKPLEGSIRISFGNVAYFQEDFTTALLQWQNGFDKLDPATPNDVKATVLYRIGLTQQKLERYTDADRSFAMVQQQYPGTPAAVEAQRRQGDRTFYLQLATFNTPAGADKYIDAIKAEKISGIKGADAKGRAVVNVGPFPTYNQAKAVKIKLGTKYSDAIVVP